jgi:PAS domain S-box-containing protein
MTRFAEVGKQAGEMGLQLLAGQHPKDQEARSDYVFDWRQLRRWKISASALPAASLVINPQPNAWESYKYQIFGAIFLALVETLLIAALLWQRAARRRVKSDLIVAHDRLRLAMETGKAVGWERDIGSGQDSWFGDLKTMFGIPSDTYIARPEDFHRYVHPEDRQQVSQAVADAERNHSPYAAEFRVVWPDGTVRWVAASGKFYYSLNGEPERMLGMAVDITDRKRLEKLAEQALLQREVELTEAQSLAQVGSWRWDVKTDTVWWSQELYRIAGMDPRMPAVSYEDRSKLYTAESWERLRAAVEEALHTGRPYELDLEMIRVDGARRWLIERGEPHRDASGAVVQLRGTVQDITERKRTEEALRESEERLRLAIQAGKMFAYEWDAATDVVVRSAESARILGIDEATHPTGQQVLTNVHPDDRERLKAAIAELTAETPYLEISYRITRPDGTLLWVERNSRAHFDNHGRMLRIVGMVADVTERKRAEEALRESEERFRLVANTAPVMIWMSGPDRLCTYFNEPWLEFTGRPLERELGNGWAEGVHPEDFATCMDTHVEAFYRREKFSMEYRLRRYDGEYRWVLDIGTPRFNEDGSFAGFIGSCVDFTDRRAAQQALRESEDELRLLLDSTAEAIYGIDLEGRCTFCNPACLRALGYERIDELLGRNMHDLIHHSRADGTRIPAETSRIMRALQTGQGVHVDDEVLWDVKGTSFPAEYWSYPQRKGQEVVGAVVTFLDITERKRTEVVLENLSRKLIGAQEQERSRIARELHDDIGQRLALLTVELGQCPLDSPDLPADVGSRIDEVRKQCSEIAADVQSLSHELHSSKLEYLGIATAMRGFCREFSAQQNVEIVFSHDAIPRMVPSDISLCLFRVLQEALHNAVKYSGVRHFDAELHASSDAIELTVRDSGSSFVVEEAMKTTGLGLVSMAERIKLVGGQLSIESHPGSGTTVHASVPLREAAQAAEA